MIELRDWLPIGIGSRDVVRNQVASAIEGWSQHWFAKRTFGVSRLTERSSGSLGGLEGDSWQLYCRDVAIRCSKAGSARLLEAALDANLSAAEMSAEDRLLLESFSRELIQDLALRLGRGLDLESQPMDEPKVVRDPFGRFGGLEIALADSLGPDVLWLALPLRALLPLTKKSLPPRRAASRPKSRKEAVAPIAVKIEATIGRADVLLSDLGALGPGDVVVLGASDTHIADLSLAGSPTAFARARLMDSDGEMTLVLEPSFQ